MLAAKGVADAPHKAVRDLTGAVQASLRNHDGKGVRSVGQGMPARWTGSIPKSTRKLSW